MKFTYSENKASYLVISGIIIFVISVLIFLLKGSWIYNYHDNIDEGKIGGFGDFIGGTIGTVFSLAGIILFYVALKEQRKDFKTNEQALNNQIEAFNQQIKEFELQRVELSETRKVYEDQSKTLKSQKFEETFYSYLNVFIERRKTLAPSDYNDFFKARTQELKLESLMPGYKGISQLKNAYERVYMENRSQLSPYFIIFYRILKMIEMSEVEDKATYHKILRSILSKDELLILYYNYHSRFGQKPIPIVLKYEYFKHLEKLSKLELQIQLIPNDQLFSLNTLVDTLSEKINQCIQKAKNLDEGDVVLEIEISKGAFVRIEIIDDLKIQLITDVGINDLFNRTLENFSTFFEHLLIDIIYSSYFADFEDTYLQRVTTNDRNQIIESYSFNPINHI